jgi:two-component system nitrate/nitrite response regulator NarL
MRLMICDERRLLVDALTPILTTRGHKVVATALDPDDAVEAAREHHPDVCLLELSSPHDHDLSAIRRIHDVSPGTKIVILSVSIETDLVNHAIAQGAQGFVGKKASIDVLVEALVLAHQGYLAVDPLLLLDVFRPHAQSQGFPPPELKLLTRREWQVLRYIKDGLSTKEMADQLGVRLNTVRTHAQNLLSKLGVHSRLQAAALMTTQLSSGTRPDLGIAIDLAAANDEPVAEAVQMDSPDTAAQPGAIKSLPEVPLEAVRGSVPDEAQLSAVRSTRNVVPIWEPGKSSKARVRVIAKLTARELDVLRCASQGLSGNQIGAMLHITPNTVRTHRRNILRKLNSDSDLTATALPRRA